jgi:hypothetical protein
MQRLNMPDDTSWWDELINGLTQKQLPPPQARGSSDQHAVRALSQLISEQKKHAIEHCVAEYILA